MIRNTFWNSIIRNPGPPQSGPEDIYALGVDSSVPVVDRMFKQSEESVMDAIVSSRNKLGDFQFIVAAENGRNFHVVTRSGTKWEVDAYNDGPFWESKPKESTWHDWAKERMKIVRNRHPLYRCDGKTVLENRARPDQKPLWTPSRFVRPDQLVSPDPGLHIPWAKDVRVVSRLYPDLTPKSGWGFEIEFAPKDHPDLVIIKRSADIATAKPMTAHEWYYINPKKGHSVVLMRTSALPREEKPTAKMRQQVFTMSDFVESKNGFWYAGRISNVTQQRRPDDDLAKPLNEFNTEILLYHFDFKSPE